MTVRRKSFAKLVAEMKKRSLHEYLQLFGDKTTTPAAAIDADWLHCLMMCLADVAEGARLTAPEEERERKRMIRQNLAKLVAFAEEWEKRL